MDTAAKGKNKRAVIILGVVMATMFLFSKAILPWWDEWQEIKVLLTAEQAKQERLEEARSKNSAITAFEMPQHEDQQRLLFEKKVNEQFQKAGLNLQGLPQYTSRGKKQSGLGVRLLNLNSKSKGNFNQILDLLTKMNENPYLVSIEDFSINCNKQKRQEMELNLTVSTFVK